MKLIRGTDFVIRVGPKRIDRTMLSTMLIYWRVMPPKPPKHEGRAAEFGVRKTGCGKALTRHMPLHVLWDLYERARAAWRAMIVKHHPDRGGSHSMCAELNVAWDRTVELFARLGIGESN
jgi:hypothetical protein